MLSGNALILALGLNPGPPLRNVLFGLTDQPSISLDFQEMAQQAGVAIPKPEFFLFTTHLVNPELDIINFPLRCSPFVHNFVASMSLRILGDIVRLPANVPPLLSPGAPL